MEVFSRYRRYLWQWIAPLSTGGKDSKSRCFLESRAARYFKCIALWISRTRAGENYYSRNYMRGNKLFVTFHGGKLKKTKNLQICFKRRSLLFHVPHLDWSTWWGRRWGHGCPKAIHHILSRFFIFKDGKFNDFVSVIFF